MNITTHSSHKLIIAAVAFVFMLLSAACGRKDTVYYSGSDDNDLLELLADEGFSLKGCGDARSALDNAPEGAAVLLLDGSYPDGILHLTPEIIETAKAKRLRVFADFACLTDTAPAIDTIACERVVVIDSLCPELQPMDLLSINRGWYAREKADNPLMVIARVAGFDTAAYGLENTTTSPLVCKPEENIWVSTSNLSDFARLRYVPEFRWKAFWELVMSDLTGHKVVFGSMPSYVRPAYGRDEALPDSARLASVRKGVEWFFNGHFLIDSTWTDEWLGKYQGDGLNPFGPALPDSVKDGDGTLGVLEGHCSAIDGTGRQAYRYWMRDDVQGEASMTFAIAGELLGNEHYKKIAENLTDFSFDAFRQGPRDDPGSPTFGLLSWSLTHPHVYYGDDNARSILGSALAADILKNSKWDEKITEAILANYRTTGRFGFRGERLEEDDIQKNGLKYYQERELVNPHPHFESWMWACYLWLYRQTGYQPLLRTAEEGISRTMAAYPAEWCWTNGLQQEKARMILPLAWLCRVSPTDEHKKWLTDMTAELLKNQDASGAIREELGDPAKGMFGKIKSNDAYGTGEAPLIFDNGDPIADMLYTCNFAFFGLNEAAHATGDKEIAAATEKLSEFLTRIQARSENVKNVDGAWFRAFNYRNWDYWASDADAGWGRISTLTGWIQSWIVTTQALMEMNTSYWDLTSGSSVGNNSTAFDRMLKK